MMKVSIHRVQRATGFTLVELMVTIAVFAIIATIAAPSFTGLLDRKRVEGLATIVASDLQLVRTEALKRNQSVRIVFTNGAAWNYSIVTATTPPVTIKTFDNSAHPSTSITGTFSNFTPTNSLTINQRLGMPNATIATTDGVVIGGNSGSTLRVTVNQVGRVAICGALGGYPPCP